ncbi:hypothetical protein HPB49_014751 [Dermacentor silvarum]|uniref:Uncharacterized protein n=1 Tax=Dermacentor silvarum TaxID=543639 RepID=A0ACB8DDR1_DERSI|nr:uncharacterized protein LOC119441110 [Dermacentor silvarum]KAH7966246.1 hypothetical protein HPB49_014751 [Dermacentor silvarum]
MSRGQRSLLLLCGLLALGLSGVLCDHRSDSPQQDQEQLLHHNSHQQQPPSSTHQHLKAERSGTYYLHDVDNKARFGGVAGVGGSGITLLLPILLVLGLFVIIIPIFGLLFTTGLAGGFGGFGGLGAGVPGGLYPAASAAGRKWTGAESPLLSQENVIKMVSFVDKALQDFGKQLKVKQS